MSTKRSNRNHRGTPKKRGPARTSPDWTRQIFLAAQEAAKDQVAHGDASEAFDRSIGVLEHHIAQSLDAGTDKHLLRAMEDLEDAGMEDAVTLAGLCADMAVSSTKVSLTTPNGKESGELRLFLIPLLLAVRPEQEIPASLPTGDIDGKSLLDLCATSFRRYGLISDDPSVVLIPWLYAYDELPETWAEQRMALRSMVTLANGGRPPIPEPAQTHSGEVVHLALRFALFGVISSDDAAGGLLLDDEMILDRDEDAEDEEETLDPRVLAWQEDFAALLTENLPALHSARIGIPGMWDEAIEEGYAMHNRLGLLLLAALRFGEKIPDTVEVTLSVCQVGDAGESLEIRISFAERDLFLFGFVWACVGNPEKELDAVLRMLRHLGLTEARIHVIDHVLGDERCAECGQITYPTHNWVPEDGDDTELGIEPQEQPRLLH